MRGLSSTVGVAIAASAMLASGPAAARRVVVIEEDEEPPSRVVTLTISPIHLVGPFFEATAEFRAARTVGLAVVGGAGRFPFQGGDARGGFWDVGAQARWYVAGSFDGGMLVGTEALWLGAPRDVDATREGANLTIAGFVGWKFVIPAGFTIDSQIGLRALAVRQHPELPSGGTVRGEGDTVQLHGAFGVGWSF